MLLSECIERRLDTTYPFFTDDAPAAEVYALMRQGHLASAPVLHEGKVCAMVTIPDLVTAVQSKKTAALSLRDLALPEQGGIGVHEHLFDIFPGALLFPGTIIPVTRDDGSYAGTIEKKVVLEKIAEVFHLGEESLTLELDVPSSGLKLSEVIASIEKNDATVLSSGLYHADSEGEGMIVTFRVLTHDWFRLVQNMGKYGYSIRYSTPLSDEGEDEMREKALEFIRLMDM
ncbi:CBS domain-containing protein [Chlorobium sp. BLA1]|uniref:CBS domain-containing protein n=1 Tax=Candidatus Chlorobium masyuteum TaxID=2716876 RepID=UPI0014247786|nr:CBS domain-containing protein [Candidatus Chlorobium masyuteum]NHQ60877.1 CBS domain-containing protein [Candidatus Chlorobium masyuteum]